MAHQLDPPEATEAHDPAEVVRRLRAEFPHVEADSVGGAEVVTAMIRRFERMSAPRPVIEEHRRLMASAIRIVVADAPDFVDA